MLQIKIFPVNPLGANCYVCWEDAGKACIVVDPGFYRPDEEEMVFSFLRENGLTPDAVFLTHAHFDHAWSAASVARRYGCPVWMSAADDPILRDHFAMLDRLKLEKTVELFRLSTPAAWIGKSSRPPDIPRDAFATGASSGASSCPGTRSSPAASAGPTWTAATTMH